MALGKCLLVFVAVCIVRGNCYIRNTYLKRIKNGMSNGSVPSATCGSELDCLTDTLTKEDIHLSLIIQCNCQSLGSDLYKKSRWKVIQEKGGSYLQVPQNTHTGRYTGTDVFSYINGTTVNTTGGKLNKENMVQTAKLFTDTVQSAGRQSAVGDAMRSIRADTTTIVADVPHGKDFFIVKDRDMKRVYIYTLPNNTYFGYQELRVDGNVTAVEICFPNHTLQWFLDDGRTCFTNRTGWHCTDRDEELSEAKFIKCDDNIMLLMTDTELKRKKGTNRPTLLKNVKRPINMMISTKERCVYWTSGFRRKLFLSKITYEGKTKNLKNRSCSDVKYINAEGTRAYACAPAPKLKALEPSTSYPFKLKQITDSCTDFAEYRDRLYILTLSRGILIMTRKNHTRQELPFKHRITRGEIQVVAAKDTRNTPQKPRSYKKGKKKTDAKKGPSLLVMAAENKAVYEFQLPKPSSAVQISFPKKNKLVAVEFCPFYNGLKWVGKKSVFSSDLAVKAPKHFMESAWTRGTLVAIKYDKKEKLIFFVTTNAINRIKWKSTDKLRIIASRIKPIHVELDEDKRYVYWSQKEAGSVTFRRVDYEGSKEERIAVLKRREVYRFSMFRYTTDGTTLNLRVCQKSDISFGILLSKVSHQLKSKDGDPPGRKMEKIEYRAVLKFLVLEGNTAKHTEERFSAVHGKSSPSSAIINAGSMNLDMAEEKYIYFCGPVPQVMYRKETMKVLDPKEKCLHVIRHEALVYVLTHSSKVKVLNMKTGQKDSWSLPRDITTGFLQLVGYDDKKAQGKQKERRKPPTKSSRKTKPKSKPAHTRSDSRRSRGSRPSSYKSSSRSRGSRSRSYGSSSRSKDSRSSSYGSSSRSRGSRPSSYDSSSRSRGSRPRSYGSSSRSRGSRPSSYGSSSRSRGSRPSSYDGSSRSRESRFNGYDSSSRSGGSRPSSYSSSSRSRGSRPSSYSSASRSRGSRPSSYDDFSRSRESRFNGYDSSSRSRGSRPSSYSSSSRSRGSRPSSYDGFSRSRESRFNGYDSSSRSRGSRPSSYGSSSRSRGSHSTVSSGHLLVMDPQKRLVWKINLLDFNLKYEIRLPGDDLIRDIDYSVSERKLLWIRSYEIIKTPLKTPRKSDLSMTSWVKREKLLRVKTDSSRIFFFTAKNLYKAHIPFNKKSRVYHVTRVHLPTDAALDETNENVHWIELNRGLFSVNRIPYSGGKSVATTHFNTLSGFTIGPNRIMYLCSPNPAKLVLKSYSRPQYLWGQNKCSDITSDGDNVYILEWPDATIAVARANGDQGTNIGRYTLDSNIGRGFLKTID